MNPIKMKVTLPMDEYIEALDMAIKLAEKMASILTECLPIVEPANKQLAEKIKEVLK
jgi:uncharacterized protein YbaP (TraB family)